MATECNTEIKEQRPSGNESDRKKLQNIKSEEHTADKAEARPVEDRHNAGKENETNVREKSSKDPAVSVQEVDLGASEDRRKIEGSGWDMAESPTMSDGHDKDGKRDINGRTKSNSDNFGQGDGRRSDNFCSPSSGKVVSRIDMKDEGRTLKTDASCENTPTIGKSSVKWCQNIWIPDAFEISLIVRTIAVSLGIIYRFRGRCFRPGYEREYRPGKIIHILASYNDLQLSRLVSKHREQLESAIKDIVENISEKLVNEQRMRELNLQEINNLTRKNQRLKASQLLLKSVLHGNIWDCRIFLNILTKMQVNLQCLITSMTQDDEEGVILQYRYNLRVQSRNMKMPTLRLISDVYTNQRITMTHSLSEDATEGRDNHVREVEIHE
ncbi:uncharacterized protein LOC134339975 isoform X2 [Mobula hypostoma]|uniref:uncharacterized protein LOC134339975 isoform X2 n=1 Tax=Mobula hypostoma TaxID=723540 RepID=UPI002FC35004